MLSKMMRLYRETKKALELGSDNFHLPKETKQTRENLHKLREKHQRMGVIRAAKKKVFIPGSPFYSSLNLNILNSKDLLFIDYYFLAILAESFRCGNCTEHAVVALVNILKSGINKSVELLEIESAEGKEEGHVALCLDRAKEFSIKDFSSWRNFGLYNSWGKSEPRRYAGDEAPTALELSAGLLKNHIKINASLRMDSNLNSDQCGMILEFLIRLRVILNAEFFQPLYEAVGRKSEFLENDLKQLYHLIDREIHCFSNLKLLPPASALIKHWETKTSIDPNQFEITGKKANNIKVLIGNRETRFEVKASAPVPDLVEDNKESKADLDDSNSVNSTLWRRTSSHSVSKLGHDFILKAVESYITQRNIKISNKDVIVKKLLTILANYEIPTGDIEKVQHAILHSLYDEVVRTGICCWQVTQHILMLDSAYLEGFFKFLQTKKLILT